MTHDQLFAFNLGLRVHPAAVALLTAVVLALAIALTLAQPPIVIADPIARNVV